MSELITVKPEEKLKGFSSENLKIVTNTKEKQVNQKRISRLLITSFYEKLSKK